MKSPHPKAASCFLAALSGLALAACSTVPPARLAALGGQIQALPAPVASPPEGELFPFINPYRDELDEGGIRSLLSLGANLDLSKVRFDRTSALPGEEILVSGVPVDAGKVRAEVALGSEKAFAMMRRLDDGRIAVVVPAPAGVVDLPSDLTLTIYVRGAAAHPYRLRVNTSPAAPGEADRLLDAAVAVFDRFGPDTPLAALRSAIDGQASGSLRTVLHEDVEGAGDVDGLLATVGAARAMAAFGDAFSFPVAPASGYRIASTGCGLPPFRTAGGEISAADLKCMMEWHDTIADSARNPWAMALQSGVQVAAAAAPFAPPQALIGVKTGASLARAARVTAVLRKVWVIGLANALVKVGTEAAVGSLPSSFKSLTVTTDGLGTDLGHPEVLGTWRARATATSTGWMFDAIDLANGALLWGSLPFGAEAKAVPMAASKFGPTLSKVVRWWQDRPEFKGLLFLLDSFNNAINAFVTASGGAAPTLSTRRWGKMDFTADVTDVSQAGYGGSAPALPGDPVPPASPAVFQVVFPNHFRPVGLGGSGTGTGCSLLHVTSTGFPSEASGSEEICTTYTPSSGPAPTPTPVPSPTPVPTPSPLSCDQTIYWVESYQGYDCSLDIWATTTVIYYTCGIEVRIDDPRYAGGYYQCGYSIDRLQDCQYDERTGCLIK